jgi:hypothetical protein
MISSRASVAAARVLRCFAWFGMLGSLIYPV